MNFTKSYLDIINGQFQGLNLTRITDPREFEEKQLEDSIIPLEKSKYFKNDLESLGIHLDIGFGGGFPLLPINFVLRGTKSLGFEARGKKAKAVQEIANQMDLRVKTYHQRLEDIFIDRPCVLTFKAVSTVKKCLSFVNTNEKLRIYFYKGPNVYDLEGEDLNINSKRWSVFESTSFKIGDEERTFIGIENKIVPCGTSPSKNLVNLSTLL